MKTIKSRIGLLAAFTLSLTSLAAPARAQDETATPLAHAPGAPAGSYKLSDLERINLFNGQMSVYMPLLAIGGRGEASHTLGLTLEAHWEVKYVNGNPPTAIAFFNRFRGIRPGYGPGTFRPYRTVEVPQNLVLTRAAFTAGDLTQNEFRDEKTEGLAQLNNFVRDTLFKAHDGSQLTFVFDAPVSDGGDLPPGTGRLLRPDGVQYRFEDGVVTSIKDRNGNFIRFENYVTPTFPSAGGRQVGTITDSLNRVASIAYATPGDHNDRITFKGFGGAPRTITVSYSALSGALVEGEQIGTLQVLFPQVPWNQPNQVHDPTVVSSVTLPNGRFYDFRYNRYGELAELTLPTGGYFRYTWGPGIAGAGPGGEFSNQIYRRLLRREVFVSNGNADTREQRTDYGLEGFVDTTHSSVTVQHRDALDTILSTETHFFHGRASDNLTLAPAPNSYPIWSDGREYRSRVQANTTTLLRTVDTTWSQLEPVHWTTPAASPVNEPRVTQVITTLNDASPPVAAVQAFAFNTVSNTHTTQYDNRTDVRESAFGGATLVRRRHTDYVTSLAYTGTAVHLRRLPLTEIVYEGESAQRARTDYVYDDYAAHPLQDRANTTGHDTANYGTGFSIRGNLSRTGRWLDTDGSTVSTSSDYDILGNVVVERDALGHATSYTFDDRFGAPGDGDVDGNAAPAEIPAGFGTFAFPTQTTNALQHTLSAQFDYHLGRAVDARDQNGVIGSAFFADPLDRLSQTIEFYARPEATRTLYTYDDSPFAPRVDVRADRDAFGDGVLHTAVLYDSLGREGVKATYEKEGGGDLIIFTGAVRYDARGRVGFVRNPLRSDEPPDQSRGTFTEYDALGRPTIITHPDMARTVLAYAGNVVTAADAANRKVRTETDALGRTVKVTEDPDALAVVTNYAFDAFDHVVQVTQAGPSGSQVRTFAYDSLERLVCESTPETRVGATACTAPLPTSGVTLFTYDADGNVLTRKDARGVVAATSYDPLHRASARTYSGESPPGTSGVTYTYDDPAVSFSKGRITALDTAGVSSTFTDQYDAAGRVRADRQVVGANTFSLAYTYDLAGQLRTQRYPSGRVVTNTYDKAGRFQQVAEGTYAYGRVADRVTDNTDGYAAHGAVMNLVLGNGLRQQRRFNCRLQQRTAGLGTSLLGVEILNLALDHGTSNSCPQTGPTPANNGNLLGQTIVVNGVTQSVQSFTYDGLNRLFTATEAPAAGAAWSQGYTYDRWGNRAVTPGSYLPGGSQTPTSLAQFDAATNRLVAPWQYDGAGNQTRDALGRTSTFDAENRQITFGSTTYAYDGAGRRVKKTVGVGGPTTTYVYDAFGRLVGEYAPSAPLGTVYLTPDHLGTTRVTTDHAGRVTGRVDYLPFGEAIETTKGNRTALPGYGSDGGVRHKFTGKERDPESGLDFFQARYHSGAQGRFGSTDPAVDLAASTSQPQRWNRYAYVTNSPLRKIDPDGAKEKDLAIGWLQGVGTAALSAAASLADAYKPMGYMGMATTLSEYVAFDAPLLARGVTHPGEVIDQYVKMSTSNNDADQRALGQAVGQGTFVAGAMVAPFAKGTTTLYRAVGPAELADIQATGELRSLAGLEGKYFTTSAEAASSYARQAVRAFGDPPYTLIRTEVPNSIFRGLTPVTVDRGIPAWLIPNSRLAGLTPKVLDFMVIPAR